MSEPVTTMDTRFSDPDADATEWAVTRRVIEVAEVFWLSTVRSDGHPHVTPVVGVWYEVALHFCTADTEQKAIRANLRKVEQADCGRHWARPDLLTGCLPYLSAVCSNLRGNPHVVLTTGRNRWDEGLDVVLEGDTVRITDQSMLERLAGVWATKWDGRWQYLVRDGYFYHHDEDEVLPDNILVFSIEPTRVFAFAKGKFSHTRHQF